jgi:hypothetical protein
VGVHLLTPAASLHLLNLITDHKRYTNLYMQSRALTTCVGAGVGTEAVGGEVSFQREARDRPRLCDAHGRRPRQWSKGSQVQKVRADEDTVPLLPGRWNGRGVVRG